MVFYFTVFYFIENIYIYFYEKREKNHILIDIYNHRETFKKRKKDKEIPQ